MKARDYMDGKRIAKGKEPVDRSHQPIEEYLVGLGMDRLEARRCRLRMDELANKGKTPPEIETALRAEIKAFRDAIDRMTPEQVEHAHSPWTDPTTLAPEQLEVAAAKIRLNGFDGTGPFAIGGMSEADRNKLADELKKR